MASKWLLVVVVAAVFVFPQHCFGERDMLLHGDTGFCTSDRFMVVSAINEFGFSVAKELERSENQLISPLSLSSALGMAYLGARDETAEQIKEALKYNTLNLSDSELHENVCELTGDISSRINGSYILNLPNALFSRTNFSISDNYKGDVEKYYHADSFEVDFGNNSEGAANFINEWARRETSGKISRILNGPLPADTNLFLTSAVYFKGSWKLHFPVQNTVDMYFHVAGEDREVVVPMMMLAKETFRYSRDDDLGYKFLELPYQGEEIVMLFVLPLRYDQVPDINMSSDLFCHIRSGMNETKLDVVVIPRFKIDYKKNLKTVLSVMGISNAFTAGVADFSGMAENKALYISDVVHASAIEVNEEGSEAAAVSGLLLRPVSALEVDDFVANHPFLFYIVDTRTGVILFSGRLMAP